MSFFSVYESLAADKALWHDIDHCLTEFAHPEIEGYLRDRYEGPTRDNAKLIQARLLHNNPINYDDITLGFITPSGGCDHICNEALNLVAFVNGLYEESLQFYEAGIDKFGDLWRYVADTIYKITLRPFRYAIKNLLDFHNENRARVKSNISNFLKPIKEAGTHFVNRRNEFVRIRRELSPSLKDRVLNRIPALMPSLLVALIDETSNENMFQ